ncbi:MAG TPA: Wzz/FepE/Etk N-terminal domain-containing protein [Geobacteraceae bacterium]
MQQHHDQSERLAPSPAGEDTINLLDYLEVIVKRKRLIIRTTLAAFVLSIVVSILLPNVYSSTAKILPPQQDSSGLMGMLMGQAGGGMASLAGDLLGKGSPADMYVGILNSDAVSDAIIDRFHLMQVYKEKYRVDAYKTLDKKVDIIAGKKDGIISITVEDKDPKRAAAMANAYVEELGRLTAQLNMTGAGQNKAFYEERLAKAKVDLARAEDNLKAFQSKNKVVSVTDQAAATIGGIAQIKAQLVAQEVQLAVLKGQFTDSSQEVKSARDSIANLKGQLARLEGNGSGGAIPGVGSVPELGEQYLRLMREFKIQETLVELLTKQDEMAKLTEAKDVAGVQVIQQARVPDKKTKPKRALIVMMTSFFVGFASLLVAFGLEYKEKMLEEDRQHWRRIKSSFRGK